MKKKIIIILIIILAIFLMGQIKTTWKVYGNTTISMGDSSVELDWSKTFSSKIAGTISLERSGRERISTSKEALEDFFKGANIEYNIDSIIFLKFGGEE